MRLYLVRHGHAVEEREDSLRRLSPLGVDQIICISEFMQSAGFHPEQIWHSGKTRARESAEILGEVLQPGLSLEQHADLNPDDDIDPVAYQLSSMDTDVMIVGHLPYLGRLVGRLLAGKDDAGWLVFSTGTAAVLERDPVGLWHLVGLWNPVFIKKRT